MERIGRLKPDKLGYCQPVDAPLYPRPPYYCRDVQAITAIFETDEDAAAEMVPEGLTIPSPAIAFAIVVNYGFSTLGAYNESYICIAVSNEGEPAAYTPHVVVDSDLAMAAGREIWGCPKKLGKIWMEHTGMGIMGVVERPAGNRLCTVVVQPEAPAEPGPTLPGFNLRVMPSPMDGEALDCAQLIEVRFTQSFHSNWTGRATLSFGGESTVDRWCALPIKKVLGGTYAKYDMDIPVGRVVRDYLAVPATSRG